MNERIPLYIDSVILHIFNASRCPIVGPSRDVAVETFDRCRIMEALYWYLLSFIPESSKRFGKASLIEMKALSAPHGPIGGRRGLGEAGAATLSVGARDFVCQP